MVGEMMDKAKLMETKNPVGVTLYKNYYTEEGIYAKRTFIQWLRREPRILAKLPLARYATKLLKDRLKFPEAPQVITIKRPEKFKVSV